MRMSDRVEESFREIFDALVDRRDSIPPLQSPVAGVTHTRTGASVGMKRDPLLKIDVFHSGIDLVYPPEEPVYATADGVVREASRAKGIVEIDGIRRRGFRLEDFLIDTVIPLLEPFNDRFEHGFPFHKLRKGFRIGPVLFGDSALLGGAENQGEKNRENNGKGHGRKDEANRPPGN